MRDFEPAAAKPIGAGLGQLLKEKSVELDAACVRFQEVNDPEALHELRVAMRRLHTLFDGFAPCFCEQSSLPERLHSLQKETNAARDLEVTLSLVEHLQLDLTPLQQRWREQLTAEYRRLRETIPSAWQGLSVELEAPRGLLVKNLPQMPLGTYAAALAKAEQKKLRQRIKSLLAVWGAKRAHRLRIRGKRVRYLLEPFVEESDAATTAVARLKKFQDLLGDYHDIVVLIQKLRTLPPNESRQNSDRLAHARRVLKKTKRKLHQRFVRQYRAEKNKRLQTAITKACASLAQF